MTDEAKAAAAIQKLGGLVKRDKHLPGNPVVEVNFQASTTGRTIRDADLVHLKGLPRLKVLYLGHVTDTTDAGLAHLAGVTSLEKLSLPDTRITDRGLAHLRGLTKLASLGFPFCKGVTDRGLVYLFDLKRLKDVNIAGTRVTERGVAALRKALPEAYIIY